MHSVNARHSPHHHEQRGEYFGVYCPWGVINSSRAMQLSSCCLPVTMTGDHSELLCITYYRSSLLWTSNYCLDFYVQV